MDPTFHAAPLDPVEEFIAAFFRDKLAAICAAADGIATRPGLVTVQRQGHDGATLSIVVGIGPDVVAMVREEMGR